MAIFVAWRTATLQRSRKVPPLARLLRRRKKVDAAEREAIRADMAALDAEFARADEEARRRAEVPVDGS